MNFRQQAIVYLSLLLLCSSAISADLPPELKRTAEEYEKAQKGYDDAVARQMKLARDVYPAALSAARKREVATKRPAGVAAIDAEIAAMNAGSIEGEPPEQLPADLRTYRDRFIADTKRAAGSADSARKHSTRQYLKWLSDMEAAVRGKDKALLTAIVAEKERVLRTVQKSEPGTK